LLLNGTAFWISKKDSWWSFFEDTFKEMHFVSFFVIGRFFTIEIGTFVEWLILHPHAIKSFLAVGFAHPGLGIHALALDELYFRVDLQDFLLCHVLPLLLDD